MDWNIRVKEASEIRKELHKIPEPCWQERKTFELVTDRLDLLGISWEACVGTGILCRLGVGKKGKHLAFRCDMDGLVMKEVNEFDYISTEPNCMHGCGHDGHMATMLAALAWLKKSEHKLQGPVTAIFQPAEEGGYGAREMIAGGALEGVDEIFGWHNWPAISFGRAVCLAGPLMAANGSFSINLTGSGGHASQPELCRDPVLAASAVNLALQQIVSRHLPPQHAGVVSVTSIDGRSSETVIPDNVTLSGSVRSVSTEGVNDIFEKIDHIACSVALGYGVNAEVDTQARYPAVINDERCAETYGQTLKNIFGSSWESREIAVPIMASEDFSYYLEKVPGAFALVGAGDGGKYSIPCHNSRYDFNEQLIEPMARAFCLLAGIEVPV
jgi:amidohydrolase